LSSVSLLPCERIAAITCDRFFLVKTSATAQAYRRAAVGSRRFCGGR
jgi:hypothetical protein